jgi:hypothetical protein
MKAQLLLFPALVASLVLAFISPVLARIILTIFLLVFLSTIPFIIKAFAKDAAIGCLSPLLLIMRSGVQFMGISCGILDNLVSRTAGNT